MARFGGNSQFGGGAQFGNGESRWIRYWRALMALYPPGAYSEAPDSLHAELVRVDGKACGDIGQVQADRLAAEIFPHTSEELLPQWEELFQVSPGPHDTVTQRQAAVAARWRSSLSSSPRHLRMMLADLLNPTTAFRDTCDDDDVSFRYAPQVGNGTITETTEQTLAVAAGIHGDWSATQQECPRNLIRLVDIADDVWCSALFNTWGGVDGTAAGVTLYQDAMHAVCFQLEQAAGAMLLRGWTMLAGVKTLRSTTVLPPVMPYWLQVSRVGEHYLLRYGASLSGLTTLDTLQVVALPFIPRWAGVWCLNLEASAYPAASVGVSEIQVRYGKTYNNVELIEVPLSEVPAGSPERKFFAFVHRDPTDPGRYSLSEAQRQADRGKQAHTLVYVGESDCARWDDPFSLYDRDIYGR